MPSIKEDIPPQPWPPGQATERVRHLATQEFDFYLTKHARDQLRQRQLFSGDVLHVLKRGHIYDEAQKSTRPGFYKYKMESSTPSSNSRTLRVIVIPSAAEMILKIVTVMWRDEDATFGGTS